MVSLNNMLMAWPTRWQTVYIVHTCQITSVSAKIKLTIGANSWYVNKGCVANMASKLFLVYACAKTNYDKIG